MKTLKIPITIPKDYVFDSFDKQSSEVLVKEQIKDLTERLKTMDDVLHLLGEDDEDVIDFRKLLDAFDMVHPITNYHAAVLITKAFNQGWLPNWKDSNEYKYYAWFWMNDGSSGFRYHVCDIWGTLSSVGSRLAFKNKVHCEYAGKQFTEVYKLFMVIE